MMRLGDLEQLKKELLWGNVYLSEKETNALVDAVDNQPTIDPESLPIVQRLIDELKRTVIERNTLAVIVYKQCWKDCFLYENGVIKTNSGCGYFNNLTRKCVLQEWTGCKNASENVRLKEPEDYFVAKAKGIE